MPAPRETPFDLPNICFMGSAVVSGIGCGVVVLTGARTDFGQVADSIAEQRVLTSFDKGINRFTWLMLRFIAGDGAARVRDQRPHQGRLAGGAAVRGGGGGRADARDAADDRDRQSGQGRAGDVAQEGHRQAPQRDPELRRDGRPVHGQDRHADAGPDHPEASPRLRGEDSRPSARIRLSEQLLPVRPQEPARCRGAEACRARRAASRSTRSYRKIDEMPFDFERRRMSVVLDSATTARTC